MYMMKNKKKGLIFIEVLISLSIISFLIINIFLILNMVVEIEKKISDIFFNNLKFSRVVLDIEERLKLSQKYQIDNKSRIPTSFEIPRENLKTGNILYLYLNTVQNNKIKNEVVVYSFIGENLEIYYGERLGNYILLEKDETEIALKEIKGKFKIDNYSVKLLGEVDGKSYEKEFY